MSSFRTSLLNQVKSYSVCTRSSFSSSKISSTIIQSSQLNCSSTTMNTLIGENRTFLNEKFSDVCGNKCFIKPMARHHSTTASFPVKETDSKDPLLLAKAIFSQGLQHVLPHRLIKSHVKLEGTILTLMDEKRTTVDLTEYKRKYVVGFGKACLPMAETLLQVMNGMIDRCIVSIPVGFRDCKNPNIEVYCGAESNIPDENSFKAAQKIVKLVRSCSSNDLLIVLISGGGSALLPYPIPPITLTEKMNLIRSLSRAGCTINELNTVRKRISLVKGGGLVQMCEAGKMISLIISDVSGSPLDIIASGPTVPNTDDPSDAIQIIQKCGLDKSVPQSILNVLNSPRPPLNLQTFDKVTNSIIGDNQLALEAAAAAAASYGLRPFIITSQLDGVASDVGRDLAILAEAISFYLNHSSSSDPNAAKSHLETINEIFDANKWHTSNIISEIFNGSCNKSIGVCLLFGGETIVKVRGNGLGGRNQELALAAGIKLGGSRNLPHVEDQIAILSAGTDGFDGPNPAAGAVVKSQTMYEADCGGLSSIEYLKNNDSYNFFRQAGGGKYHIISGHTETNVMDITMVVILKKNEGYRVRKKSML